MNKEQRKQRFTIKTKPKVAEGPPPRITGTCYVLFRFDLHRLVLKGGADGLVDKGNVFSVSIERGKYYINSGSASAIEDQNGDVSVLFDQKLSMQVALHKLEGGSFSVMDRKLTVKRKLKSSPLFAADVGSVVLPLHAIFAAQKQADAANHEYILKNCAHPSMNGSFISLGIRYKMTGESSPLMPKNTFYPLNTSPALPMHSRLAQTGATRNSGTGAYVSTEVGNGVTALVAILKEEEEEEDKEDKEDKDKDKQDGGDSDTDDTVDGQISSTGGKRAQPLTELGHLELKCADQEKKLRHFAALILHLRSKRGANKRLKQEEQQLKQGHLREHLKRNGDTDNHDGRSPYAVTVNNPTFEEDGGGDDDDAGDEKNDRNTSRSFLQSRLQYRKAAITSLIACDASSNSESSSGGEEECGATFTYNSNNDNDNNNDNSSIHSRLVITEQQARQQTENQRRKNTKSPLPAVLMGRRELEHKLKMAQRQIMDQSNEISSSKAEIQILRDFQRQLCSAALDNVTTVAAAGASSPSPHAADIVSPVGASLFPSSQSLDDDNNNTIKNTKYKSNKDGSAVYFPLSISEQAVLLNEQVCRDSEIIGLLYEENEELKLETDGLREQVRGYKRQVESLQEEGLQYNKTQLYSYPHPHPHQLVGHQQQQLLQEEEEEEEEEEKKNYQANENSKNERNDEHKDGHFYFHDRLNYMQRSSAKSDLNLRASDKDNSDCIENNSNNENTELDGSQSGDEYVSGARARSTHKKSKNFMLQNIQEKDEETEKAVEIEEEKRKKEKQSIEILVNTLLRTVTHQLTTFDASYRSLEIACTHKISQNIERLSTVEGALASLVSHLKNKSPLTSAERNREGRNRFLSVAGLSDLADARSEVESLSDEVRDKVIDMQEMRAIMQQQRQTIESLSAELSSKETYMALSLLDLTSQLTAAEQRTTELASAAVDKEEQLSREIKDMQIELEKSRQTMDFVVRDANTRYGDMQLELSAVSQEKKKVEKALRATTGALTEKERQLSNEMEAARAELKRTKEEHAALLMATVEEKKLEHTKAIERDREKEREKEREREREREKEKAINIAAEKQFTQCKDKLQAAEDEIGSLKKLQLRQQEQKEQYDQERAEEQHLLLREKSQLLEEANAQLKKAQKKVRSLTALLAEAAALPPPLKKKKEEDEEEEKEEKEKKDGEIEEGKKEKEKGRDTDIDTDKNKITAALSERVLKAEEAAEAASSALTSKEAECDSILQELINVKMEFAMLSASMG